jgi:type II secretory pathway component PulF
LVAPAPKPLSSDDARQLAEHLAVLAQSGVPLAPTLFAAAEEIPNVRLASGMKMLAEQLQAGATLDDVLAKNPRFLPPHLQQLIVTAARSGNLPEVLMQVVEIDRQSADLRRSMWMALAYPMLLLMLWVALVVFFIGWLGPGLRQLLNEFRMDLPIGTKLVYSISGDFAFKAVAILAAAIPMIVVGLRVSLRPQGWQRLLTEIPLVGPTLQWRGVANWCRLLALLLRQGIPLPVAAKLASEGVYAPLMAIDGLRVSKMLESGRSLANSLAAVRDIPPTLAPLAQWGEGHGALSEALDSAASVFETRVRLHAALVQSVLPPLVFILIAIGTLGLLSATIGPLVGIVQDFSTAFSWRSRAQTAVSRQETEMVSLIVFGAMVAVWLAMSIMIWVRRFVLGAFLAELAGISSRRPSRFVAAIRGLFRTAYWTLSFLILFWGMAGLAGVWGAVSQWIPPNPATSTIPSFMGAPRWPSIVTPLGGILGSWAFFLWIAILIIALVSKMRFGDSRRRALLSLIAVAIEKGIPLAPIVRAFAAERDDKLAEQAQRMAMALDQGTRIDAAIEQSGIRLPIDALVAVRGGLGGKSLAPLLRDSASKAAKNDFLVQGAAGRMFYLIVLAIATFAMAMYVVTQIVPTYLRIFNQFRTPPPGVVVALQESFSIFSENWPIGALIFMATLGSLVFAAARYAGLIHWDPPLVRRFTKPLDSAIIIRTLAKSVDAHVALRETMTSLANSYPRPYIRRRLTQASRQIEHGAHWCDSLVRSGLLSKADGAVLAAADRLGNLAWALDDMANRLERRFTNRLTGLLAIGIPAVLVLFGLVVLFISAGMIYPLARLILHLS